MDGLDVGNIILMDGDGKVVSSMVGCWDGVEMGVMVGRCNGWAEGCDVGCIVGS